MSAVLREGAWPRSWAMARCVLPLDRPRLIAILNLTPDSFHESSRVADPAQAVDRAERAMAEGADALDMGGESTRPGAPRIDAEGQCRRVIPAIEAIRRSLGAAGRAPILVDTTLEPVARAALDAGANAVNDVSAGLESPGMLRLVAERGAGLILMHRLAPPTADSYSDRYQREPEYAGGVVANVLGFLRARVSAAEAAGVARGALVLDPGLGFGKSVDQNLELIAKSGDLAGLGYPVLSALSRKSFVGRVGLGRDSSPDERLTATLALSVMHLAAGAILFRVHDVAPHAEALRAAWAVRSVAGDLPGDERRCSRLG